MSHAGSLHGVSPKPQGTCQLDRAGGLATDFTSSSRHSSLRYRLAWPIRPLARCMIHSSQLLNRTASPQSALARRWSAFTFIAPRTHARIDCMRHVLERRR